MNKIHQQDHLDYCSRINLGSYYTNTEFVDSVWDMIDEHIDEETVIADTSCGYGNFFKNHPKMLGVDIDELAINKAKQTHKGVDFFVGNALQQVSRDTYNIGDSKLCIVGNPPYNDRNSIIRNHLKEQSVAIDNDIQTRDLGMSFLLSYQKLEAEVICVLHPLSYLIKRANFNLLKRFSQNYRLEQAKIINSQVFKGTSKSMGFPIIIALYKRDDKGMDYNYIQNFEFEADNKKFKLNQLDSIKSYLRKYPNKCQTPTNNDILFWTMRDINALKRNRTFIDKWTYNAIIVDKSQLNYYIYVDVFKQFSQHIPYYFGNCDVIIDNNLFQQYQQYFILECLSRNTNLRQYFTNVDFNKAEAVEEGKKKIQEYLHKLLGVHYVN